MWLFSCCQMSLQLPAILTTADNVEARAKSKKSQSPNWKPHKWISHCR